MNYDLMNLTFRVDPMKYQPEAHELCVFIPAGITSTEELVDRLEEDLGRPDYRVMNWAQTLRDLLRFWDDWEVTLQRVILLHQDLPLLHESKDGWYLLQIYLEVLLDCMDFLQGKNATQADPSPQRELVAIFPAHLHEDLLAVLMHPPAWTVSVGFPEYEIDHEFDPTWSTVLRYLHYLDGVMIHLCTLEREDVGSMTVYYRRENGTYFLEYRHALKGGWDGKFGSTEADASRFTGLSFGVVVEVMETFFTQSELSSTVLWLDLQAAGMERQEEMRGQRYYRMEGEALFVANAGMIRDTIQEGMVKASIESSHKVSSLEYWLDVVAQQHAPVERRLPALCIIGMSDLPQAAALIRPFLTSPEKRERWVSAPLLGMRREEEVLPLLLGMLTDEMPFKKEDGSPYDPWYDSWRPYAIRLLRLWRTPAVQKQLRDAVLIWDEAEDLFDPNYEVWISTIKAMRQTLKHWDVDER